MALILSSFTSFSLFVSLLYDLSALFLLKLAFLSFIHIPEETQLLSSLLPYMFFPLPQLRACCGRCTRWVSGEHICVCTVCVCWDVGVGGGNEGCSFLCSPCLIMCLINSRCRALCSSSPLIQLHTHSFTPNRRGETQSLPHYDPQQWTLQRDGEKERAQERE